MTEAEWWACPDPDPMLLFLRGRASDRKLRLFASACARRIWDIMEDERSRLVVELVEQTADGLANSALLRVAQRENDAFCQTLLARTAPHIAARMANAVAAGAAWPAAWNAVSEVRSALRHNFDVRASLEAGQQRLLLIEVFGNPFRPPTLDPSWLRWNDSTVPKIAHGIYEERAFDRMPILHDALLDAGCDNEDALAHCREPGPHVRGCWVVDLLLGKS
jgi:hypothetical protein